MKQNVKNTAFLALCTSLALILSYVEVLLPPIFAAVPGIKMGLANIVVIFLLYRCSLREAAAVSLVRIVLVALLFGNAASLIYSLSGGILSLAVMVLLRKAGLFSELGVSVAGGVFHNAGQVLAAMILLDTPELLYYLTVLTVTGSLAGIFVGFCGSVLIKKIPKKF